MKIHRVAVNNRKSQLELSVRSVKVFPKEFKGQMFAAEHGSWNRSVRTGYEVILVPM